MIEYGSTDSEWTFSKKRLGRLVALIGCAAVMSACSGSDDSPSPEANTSAQSLGDDKGRTSPDRDEPKSVISLEAKPEELIAAWPHGFDRHHDYVEATVLSLGNVRVSADGEVAIAPTPAVWASGKVI